MPSDQTRIAPSFLSGLGWIAILGSVLLILGNVVGSIIVPGHDFVADTVSDLAAGKYEIIQDLALYGFAASLAALALAGAHLHRGGRLWSALSFGLMLLAVCVVVIAARNEYGDNDNEGIVIHIYVVYLLGLLFAGVFCLAAVLDTGFEKWFRSLSWVCFGLWIVAAPIFFFLPTSMDGLWERGLGAICVVWSVGFGVALLRQSRRVEPDGRI